MFYLKYYKPLIASLVYSKNRKRCIKIYSKKINKLYLKLNHLLNSYLTHNSKICFFTFKYKTQLNILKQSRFKLRHDITFNKNHSFIKFSH